MAGYNPISGGFLNAISGGRFGRPTNYGLQRAYQKRIDMIQKNLDDNKYRDPKKQIEKLKKLKEEKRKEAEALRIATETRQREAQESQKQADQARINRAYREETGGQGGSYATGESGIQRDSRGREVGYNDPFDPGGGE